MNDMVLRLRAPAKINLTLDVVGKREDGYHEISSVMQQVSLFDSVELRLNRTGEINIKTNARFIPCDGRNICYKAAKIYFDESNISGFGADIFIKKIIPTSAGLAGGSSDGAAVLRGLEKIFSGFGERLPEIAVKIGADIPFCLCGGSCLCEGIGERITPLVFGGRRVHLVIAKNTRGLSTPVIYSLYDNAKLPTHKGSSESMSKALESGDAQKIASLLSNDLEAVSIGEKPEIAALKSELISHGALGALMSGSGPSVFGIFSDESSAKRCCSALKAKKINAYHAYFLRRGE